MEEGILVVRVSKTKLWFAILFILAAMFYGGISTYLIVTHSAENIYPLFVFFGILSMLPAIGLLIYYFMVQITFYADGRIVYRDIFGSKKTVNRSKVKKIRVSTDNSFRKWTSLLNKNGRELIKICGNMQGYEEVYPIVRDYHVPIEYWRYSKLGIYKRTWENKP